jgi:hypothetical protein
MWPTVIFIFIPITPIPIHHPLHTCRPIMSWWARRSSPSAARCSTLSPLRLDGSICWRGPSLHCRTRAADAAAARRRNFPSELSPLYSSRSPVVRSFAPASRATHPSSMADNHDGPSLCSVDLTRESGDGRTEGGARWA